MDGQIIDLERGRDFVVKDDAQRLVERVLRDAAESEDYVADTRNLSLGIANLPAIREATEAGSGIPGARYELVNHDMKIRNGILPTGHEQIASKLAIPAKFYGRLQEDHPDLLCDTVNTLLQREPERRMVRTLRGEVRGYLSDRFRRIDHLDVLRVMLPILSECGYQFVSGAITDRRLHFRAILPHQRGEIRRGEILQGGLTFSNSEIGYGALNLAPFAHEVKCSNGLMIPWGKMRKTHIGQRLEDDGFLSDETKALDDEVFLRKIADTIRNFADPVWFNEAIRRMMDADTLTLDSPIAATQVLAKRFGMTQAETEMVQNTLVRDSVNGSLLDLAQAVTRTAQDLEFERRVEFEMKAGELLYLPVSSQHEITRAA